MKKLALILAVCCFFLVSCGDEAVKKEESLEKSVQNTKNEKPEAAKAEDKKEEKKETEPTPSNAPTETPSDAPTTPPTETVDMPTTKEEIPKVELIYAKTPEEAAEKCIGAFKAGKLSDAAQYATPDGKAFVSLGLFRSKMVKSFGVVGNTELRELADDLVSKVLQKFVYTKTGSQVNGNSATVTYSVSMPDISKIDYSKYADSYMASKGITIEQQMKEIEGMSEAESLTWSKKFALEVMIYIFTNNSNFESKTGTTTVSLEKHSNGWLVSDIKNE